MRRENKLVFFRFFAFLIDNILLFSLSNFALIVLASFLLLFQPTVLFARINLLITFLMIMYFSVSESKLMNNATIGKKLFGLKIMSKDKSYSFRRSFLRVFIFICISLFINYCYFEIASNFIDIYNFVKFWPFALAGFIFIILFLPVSIIFGNEKRGMHDILSGTQVVFKKDKTDDVSNDRIYKKKAFYLTLLCTLIISLTSVLLLKIVDKTMFGGGLIASCEKYLRVQWPKLSLKDSGDAISGFKKIFDGVPAEFEMSSSNADGQHFSLAVKPSNKSRSLLGDIFKLPPVMKYTVFAYSFSLSRTHDSLNLINVNTAQLLNIPPNVPIIYCGIFLDANGYNSSVTRITIAFKTIERIKKTLKIAREVPIICVKIAKKVNVGWVELENCEKYYAVTDKGIFVNYDTGTSYISFAGVFWLASLTPKPYIASYNSW